MFPFLALPVQLRTAIYEQNLISPVQPVIFRFPGRREPPRNLAIHLNILLICRQVYNEALLVVCNSNIYRVVLDASNRRAWTQRASHDPRTDETCRDLDVRCCLDQLLQRLVYMVWSHEHSEGGLAPTQPSRKDGSD